MARRDAAARGIGNSLVAARAYALGTAAAGGRRARADPRAARGVPGGLPAEDRLAGERAVRRGLRVILGSALLAVLAFWLDARGIVTWPQVRDQAGEIAATIRNAVTAADPGLVKELKWNIPFDWTRLHAPVELEGLPEGPWQGIQGSNLALAALVLLASALSGRRLTGFLALVAAAIALFGAKAGMTLPAHLGALRLRR